MNLGELFWEITANYRKFGWTLRGVLLTEAARRELTQTLTTLAAQNVVSETSDINALWFSRAADNHRETWELRLLSVAPFALLETFEQNILAAEQIQRRQMMLEKMRLNRQKSKV